MPPWTRFLLLLLLFPSTILNAQVNIANHWYLGDSTNLDFTSGTPVMGQNGSHITYEGCATYSDANGNLLFYTNGGPVLPDYPGGIWNANHVLMDNGNLDSANGCLSSRRGTFTFPDPALPSIYHMFTVGCAERQYTGGLRYNKIDMSQNGGLGRVVIKDSLVHRQPRFREDVHGLINSEGNGYWIFMLFRDQSGMSQPDTIVSFEVTGAGISGPFQQTLSCSTCHYQAASPNGRNYIFGEDLFDVNTANGQFTNQRSYLNGGGLGCVAFSPNSNLVYTVQNSGNGVFLYQYRLDTADIPASAIPVAPLSALQDVWGIQMGPDGKLYFISILGQVGFVECPNKRGLACNVNTNLMSLPSTGIFTPLEFPTYPAHFFASDDSCGAVVVGLEAANEQALFQVYPNPTSEVVKIELANKGIGEERVQLRLIAMDGREVLRKEQDTGSFPVRLELSEVPKGVYFLEAKQGDSYYHQRLVVE